MRLTAKHLETGFRIVWKGVDWSWKNPHLILGTWMAVWGSMLAYVAVRTGLGSALTLGVTGLGSMTSLTGFMIPLFASFIMVSKELVPLLWSWAEDAAYRVIRKVIREVQEAMEKIKEIAERVWKKIQELFQRIQDVFNMISGKAKEALNKVADTAKNVAGKVSNTAKNVVNKAGDGVKKAGNAIKKLLGTHTELLQELDALDQLAPEGVSSTSRIRRVTTEMVNSALFEAQSGSLASLALGSSNELQQSPASSTLLSEGTRHVLQAYDGLITQIGLV